MNELLGWLVIAVLTAALLAAGVFMAYEVWRAIYRRLGPSADERGVRQAMRERKRALRRPSE